MLLDVNSFLICLNSANVIYTETDCGFKAPGIQHCVLQCVTSHAAIELWTCVFMLQ